MISSKTVKFVLFALSIIILQVVCENDEDTWIVDAAESESLPDLENVNSARMACQATEEYSRCEGNPLCQKNCENVNEPGVPCPKRSCIEGCVCKISFVRSELNGHCIPENQCGRVKH